MLSTDSIFKLKNKKKSAIEPACTSDVGLRFVPEDGYSMPES